jgi:hypothetical protein
VVCPNGGTDHVSDISFGEGGNVTEPAHWLGHGGKRWGVLNEGASWGVADLVRVASSTVTASCSCLEVCEMALDSWRSEGGRSVLVWVAMSDALPGRWGIPHPGPTRNSITTPASWRVTIMPLYCWSHLVVAGSLCRPGLLSSAFGRCWPG